jgi:threonine dehydrogenase-like Zn-dependent dehydrogenase
MAAERLEFYGQPLAVGDRVTHCPDIVCGRCYSCTHVQGYVWCDRSQCYGNSFTSAEAPHLLAAGRSTSTCVRTPSSTRCRAGCRPGSRCWPS